jgi:CheY-like chemotaxis protein
VKFTPRGGRVDAYVEHAGANVEVRVQDTGEGIEPQFLPYVFDRFRQADASSARRHGGLGLGLSIVKQLVELHGGEVDVESEGHGRGTTFTVRLPLPAHAGDAAATKPQRGQAHAASEREAARGRLEGVRALVVDDERDARELVQRLLEEAGARAATAASTRDALEQLEQAPFDVLVSDIGMPGEDGYELIRRVRESRGAQSLPALALTAYARPEDRARVIAAGFQQHLAKPLDPARVVSLVASLVQAHASG